MPNDFPQGRLARLYALIHRVLVQSSLGSRSLTSFAINVTGMGLGFVSQVAMGRWLGPAEFGSYAIHLGWVNVGAMLAKIHLDGAAPRFAASYASTGDWARLRGFIRRSHQLVIGASLVLMVAAVLWALASAQRRGTEETRTTLVAIGLVAPIALMALSSTLLQGFRHVVASQVPNQIVRPLLILGIAGLAFVTFRQTHSTTIAMAASLAGTSVAALVSSALLRRHRPNETRTVSPVFETKGWVNVAVWFLLSDIFQLVVSQHSDVIVVGALLSKRDAGVYAAANQLTALVLFGSTAVAFASTPVIAALHAQSRREKLQTLLGLLTSANLAVTLPAALGLVLIGRFALGLFGAGFTDGFPVLLILCLSQVVVGGFGTVAATLLSMTGKQVVQTWIIGACAVVYLVCAYFLTRAFGIVGTATATLISTALRTLLYQVYVRRHMGYSLRPRMGGLETA